MLLYLQYKQYITLVFYLPLLRTVSSEPQITKQYNFKYCYLNIVYEIMNLFQIRRPRVDSNLVIRNTNLATRPLLTVTDSLTATDFLGKLVFG